MDDGERRVIPCGDDARRGDERRDAPLRDPALLELGDCGAGARLTGAGFARPDRRRVGAGLI